MVSKLTLRVGCFLPLKMKQVHLCLNQVGLFLTIETGKIIQFDYIFKTLRVETGFATKYVFYFYDVCCICTRIFC